jgi:hypothetical protein
MARGSICESEHVIPLVTVGAVETPLQGDKRLHERVASG